MSTEKDIHEDFETGTPVDEEAQLMKIPTRRGEVKKSILELSENGLKS